MMKTFAAATLAAALALSPVLAFAQADTAMPDKGMSDKAMAPKKTMTKSHHAHKKPMTKPTMEAQPKM